MTYDMINASWVKKILDSANFFSFNAKFVSFVYTKVQILTLLLLYLSCIQNVATSNSGTSKKAWLRLRNTDLKRHNKIRTRKQLNFITYFIRGCKGLHKIRSYTLKHKIECCTRKGCRRIF